MAIKANVKGGSVIVTGKEGEPMVINLPFERIDLVGFEKGAGGYACHDRHPSTPINVRASEQTLITTKTKPQKSIRIKGA